MTDTSIAIMVASIPPTLTALGALLIGLRNSKKATEIHTLVNSNLSTAKAERDAERLRVDTLTALLTSANARIDILTAMIGGKLGAVTIKVPAAADDKGA